MFSLQRVRARLAAPRLDARLAAGENYDSTPVLRYRAAQLLSSRSRRRIASGLERVALQTTRADTFPAAIPVNVEAVATARPALRQLAIALRERESIEPRGAALAQLLLTEPASALYRPHYADELYELAREALFALGSVDAVETSRRRPGSAALR